MRSVRRSGVDTISNLPCNVLDTILGCLTLKDAVKTSVLSKDWRYKWVTRPELVFDDTFFKSFAHVKEAKKIIHQVLSLHKGSMLMFRLQGPNLRSCPDINQWILLLSRKNVHKFNLYIYLGDRHQLPSHLFTFQQLRHLKLHRCRFDPPPSFKGFNRLVNLEFSAVSFVPAVFCDLISRCPLLEQLSLRECTGFDVLEIDAANLKCFEFTGKSKSICFKNAPMLGKVSVHLDYSVLKDASSVCPNLMKFFHYMPSLQELNINDWLLQYLARGGVPESPLAALNNVKSLNISTLFFRKIEEVAFVVYLINSCPKLQRLTIDCESGNGHVESVAEFLRAKPFKSDVLKQLQRVRLNWFSGDTTEMEFVRLILESAPVLEEMSLWNYSCLLMWMPSRLMDELKEYRSASPSVKFIVEEDEVYDEPPTEFIDDQVVMDMIDEADHEPPAEFIDDQVVMDVIDEADHEPPAEFIDDQVVMDLIDEVDPDLL